MNATPLALLHPGPAVGFEQPFEMLLACHERVQRSLDLLQRLGAHLDDHGPDSEAAAAAHDVMRYFDIAAPLHHEDEERHLLPRLRACGQATLAQRLANDHEALASAWGRWRDVLAGVCAGHWDADRSAAVRAGWHDFQSFYVAHIALEESAVFPSLAEALHEDALGAMGREMAARRHPAAHEPARETEPPP